MARLPQNEPSKKTLPLIIRDCNTALKIEIAAAQ